MTWMEWYDRLWKPSWTPAPATIGLIWQLLYPEIMITFGFVFVQAFRQKSSENEVRAARRCHVEKAVEFLPNLKVTQNFFVELHFE